MSQTLREVCASFEYRSVLNKPCLANDFASILELSNPILQKKCDVCGIKIDKTELVEIKEGKSRNFVPHPPLCKINSKMTTLSGEASTS